MVARRAASRRHAFEICLASPSRFSPFTMATDHSHSLDWTGWSEPQAYFGLEVQDPWSKLLLDGTKSIEVRAYDLPSALLGKRIYILQSKAGKSGTSSLGNVIDLIVKERSVEVVGWVVFGAVKVYTSKEEFRDDEHLHCVDGCSSYGWSEGHTSVLYGWLVSEVNECVEDSLHFRRATRRMRSIFELQ